MKLDLMLKGLKYIELEKLEREKYIENKNKQEI